jgi:[protein-PII] uridylyltransferase
MEDAYFTGWTPTEVQGHAALGRRAEASGGAAASARIRTEHNAAEVIIAAKGRQGLFADLASVMANLGANIVGARVYTSKSGQALDVFYVQDASGAPYGAENPAALTRLSQVLEAAARGEPQQFEARRAYELGRAAAFSISPVITVDNEASADATVIEISARDRPGLLEAVARTLAEAGLSIASAHIDNYGERAVDAFYVLHDGGKLTDTRRINGLKKVLAESLADDEQVPAGRPRLQRARASNAR